MLLTNKCSRKMLTYAEQSLSLSVLTMQTEVRQFDELSAINQKLLHLHLK